MDQWNFTVSDHELPIEMTQKEPSSFLATPLLEYHLMLMLTDP